MKNLSFALMIVGAASVACGLLAHQQWAFWAGLGVSFFGEYVPRFTPPIRVTRDHNRPVATMPIERSPAREKSA